MVWIDAPQYPNEPVPFPIGGAEQLYHKFCEDGVYLGNDGGGKGYLVVSGVLETPQDKFACLPCIVTTVELSGGIGILPNGVTHIIEVEDADDGRK